jgi:hypothetical protein
MYGNSVTCCTMQRLAVSLSLTVCSSTALIAPASPPSPLALSSLAAACSAAVFCFCCAWSCACSRSIQLCGPSDCRPRELLDSVEAEKPLVAGRKGGRGREAEKPPLLRLTDRRAPLKGLAARTRGAALSAAFEERLAVRTCVLRDGPPTPAAADRARLGWLSSAGCTICANDRWRWWAACDGCGKGGRGGLQQLQRRL